MDRWREKYKGAASNTDADLITTHAFMGGEIGISVTRDAKVKTEFYDDYVKARTGPHPERICMDEKLTKPYTQTFADVDIESRNPIPDAYGTRTASILVQNVANFFPELKNAKKSTSPLTINQYEEDNSLLQKTIKKYNKFCEKTGDWLGAGTGKHRLRCMVLTPNEQGAEKYEGIGYIPRQKADGTIYYKFPLHLYWIGRLHVTPSQLKVMMLTGTNTLEKVMPRNQDGDNPWDSVIDMGPYNEAAGGMRMPLSWKKERCSACNKMSKAKRQEKKIQDKQQKLGCANCDEGWIWKDRQYVPRCVLDMDGNIDNDAWWIIQDPYVFTKAACIHSWAKEVKTKWIAPSDCPVLLKDIEEQNYKRYQSKKAKKSGKMQGPVYVGEYLDPSSELAQMVLQTIRESDINCKWGDIEIVSMRRGTEKRYNIEVEGIFLEIHF